MTIRVRRERHAPVASNAAVPDSSRRDFSLWGRLTGWFDALVRRVVDPRPSAETRESTSVTTIMGQLDELECRVQRLTELIDDLSHFRGRSSMGGVMRLANAKPRRPAPEWPSTEPYDLH